MKLKQSLAFIITGARCVNLCIWEHFYGLSETMSIITHSAWTNEEQIHVVSPELTLELHWNYFHVFLLCRTGMHVLPLYRNVTWEVKGCVPCRDVHPPWSHWRTDPQWRRHGWYGRWWMSWWTDSLPAGLFPLSGWRPLSPQSSSGTHSHLFTYKQN